MMHFTLYLQLDPENPDNTIHKYMISAINKPFALEATAWPY